MRRAHVSAACLIVTSLTCCPAHAEDDWWGSDKALHFGASAGIAGGAYALTSALTQSRTIRCVGGTAGSLIVGAAKEGYDAAGYGDASWRDFTWDVVGTAFGVVVAFAIDQLISETGNEGSVDGKVAPAALTVRF